MSARSKQTSSYRSATPQPRRSGEDGGNPPSVAVVGGGIAGLTAARELLRAGFPVEVFDKGRGAGGRASTRREGSLRFDHGAQYFTTRDPRFCRQVDAWREDGVAAEWEGRFAALGPAETEQVSVHQRCPSRLPEPKDRGPARFVGVPGMNAIVKRLAETVPVRFGVQIDEVDRAKSGWRLHDTSGNEHSKFDLLLLALPPEQSLALLSRVRSPVVERFQTVRSEPCWAVLMSFDERLPLEFDGAFVESSPLAWIARDSSKPGRPDGERWVLHAGAKWSTRHLEASEDEVAQNLLRSFFETVGLASSAPAFLTAHRWRFAKVEEPLTEGCLWDRESSLGVCGDWCQGCRVEGAFLSGLEMAGRVVAAVG